MIVVSKKVLVVGIDALDSETLKRHQSELPNFSKLMRETGDINFDGVFPPDSPTCWASIYTGLNPAKHGILLFVDPLKRVSTMVSKDVDDSNIRHKTFWDIAGENGRKVCILPHLLGYPVWSVNGVMIGRSGITQDTQVYPRELAQRYNVSKFKWELKNFPGRNKMQYVHLARDQLNREVEFALELLVKEKWDVFFVSFGELDSIQYSFWNYYDKEDPGYPGENKYESVIPDFYKVFDKVMGRFLFSIDKNTVLLVVSDHGIGSRPVRLFNLNELFRQKGFLKIKSTIKQINISSRVGLKKRLIQIVDRYKLANLATLGLRLYPKGKDWFLSTQHVDWEKSVAYLTDQSGIKNYPYGGVIVNSCIGVDYNEIRDEIIGFLKEIEDPVSKEKIVKWVRKREDLYSGVYNNTYPDILFEFNEEFGAGSATPADLFDTSSSHNIAPGCHKQHHATFLFGNLSKNCLKKQITLMDVTPTILTLLGICLENYEFDGENIFDDSFEKYP